MKVSFLSIYVPTPENYGGPSALPYYILKHREADIDVEIFTYNLNNVSQQIIKKIEADLNLKIHTFKVPAWYEWMRKHHFTWFRVFLKYNLETYIKPTKQQLQLLVSGKPDLIWRYKGDFITVSSKLPEYKHLVSEPDCPSLVYFRQLCDSTGYKSFLFYLGLAKVTYSAILNTKADATSNSLHHVVGMDDWREMKKIAPEKKTFFLLHPHYELTSSPVISLNKETIKVVIAGKYDLYMKSGIDQLLPVMKNFTNKIKQRYEFTFLGKDWENVCADLQRAGLNCKHISWVDKYIESLCEYDIQLSPITVGAGMKGKVLDAIANGLLTIGTQVALENIAVRNMESCILYKDATQLPAIFLSILNNPTKYEEIARKGMMSTRKLHSPERCSNRFWSIAKKFVKGEYHE